MARGGRRKKGSRMMRRRRFDPIAKARAEECVTRRLARTFGRVTVIRAMDALGYDPAVDNPRAWEFERLQDECRRIVREGVG